MVSVTERRRTGGAKLVSGSHLSCFARHQAEIGYRGGHEGLEQGLLSPKVACLAHPELHQASKAPLSCLPELAVAGVVLALLEPPTLLQQTFLRMERDSAAFPRSRPDATGSKLTAGTDRRVELKRQIRLAPPGPVLAAPSAYHGVGLLSRGTSAGSSLQVDREVFLGEVLPTPTSGHPNDELASRLCKARRVTPSP